VVKTRITVQITDEEICFSPATVKALESMSESETLVVLMEVAAFYAALLDGLAIEAAAMMTGEGETKH
jgi:hypothetical protein